MNCVVVNKIPSQLYKFVQLLDRLKEKKINLCWKATEIRLPWLVGTCQHCLSSLIISKITMFHSIRVSVLVLICIHLVYLVTFVMWTFFLFPFLFMEAVIWPTRNCFHLHILICFRGLFFQLIFWISRICNQLIFQINIVKYHYSQ